ATARAQLVDRLMRLRWAASPARSCEDAPMSSSGRNDRCPCGSGKKATKCCGASASGEPEEAHVRLLPRLVQDLMTSVDRAVGKDEKFSKLLDFLGTRVLDPSPDMRLAALAMAWIAFEPRDEGSLAQGWREG